VVVEEKGTKASAAATVAEEEELVAAMPRFFWWGRGRSKRGRVSLSPIGTTRGCGLWWSVCPPGALVPGGTHKATRVVTRVSAEPSRLPSRVQSPRARTSRVGEFRVSRPAGLPCGGLLGRLAVGYVGSSL
jgi:hypothetical protein